MKCYHCGKDLKDNWILQMAARIMGRRSAKAQNNRARCPVHGTYLDAEGQCRMCANEEDKSRLET
jgi:phenylpropionate dioxygenase-like ring-hydroxylating dioxygenase large terminal subunit